MTAYTTNESLLHFWLGKFATMLLFQLIYNYLQLSYATTFKFWQSPFPAIRRFKTIAFAIHNTYLSILPNASPAVPTCTSLMTSLSYIFTSSNQKGASHQTKMSNKFLEQLFTLCRLRKIHRKSPACNTSQTVKIQTA